MRLAALRLQKRSYCRRVLGKHHDRVDRHFMGLRLKRFETRIGNDTKTTKIQRPKEE
jgi:hypothetical protein